MFGSIFYNLWAALIGFTIYFFATLSDTAVPLNSLIGSFIAAVFSFVLMFAIRYLLGYILYTPGDHLFDSLKKENEQLRELMATQGEAAGNTSTVEFQDENSEEIAKLVKTMLLQDESSSGVSQ